VEVLKLRRTLALWASVLVPLLVIAMTTALNLSRDSLPRPGGTVTPWDSLMLNLVLLLWCLIGLPLFVTLETALLAGLEHRENTWKSLFALPVERWTIYVAKLLVGAGLVCLSTLVIAVGIGLEGLILLTLRPALGLAQPIPWGVIILRSSSFTVAALLLLAVQAWVAMRWRSFVVPLTLGIAGTVAGLLLSTSPRAGQLASVFPWSLPYAAIARPNLQGTAFMVGILGGVLIAALGCWELVRRDVA
jgi:ABC-2 type transport system permease protein